MNKTMRKIKIQKKKNKTNKQKREWEMRCIEMQLYIYTLYSMMMTLHARASRDVIITSPPRAYYV